MKNSVILILLLSVLVKHASSQDSLQLEKPKKNFFQVALIYSPTLTVGQNPYGEGSTFEAQLAHSYGVKFSYSKYGKVFIDQCLNFKSNKFNTYLIDSTFSDAGITGYAKVSSLWVNSQVGLGIHVNFFSKRLRMTSGFYVCANVLFNDNNEVQFNSDPSKNFTYPLDYDVEGNIFGYSGISWKIYCGITYHFNSLFLASITPYFESAKYDFVFNQSSQGYIPTFAVPMAYHLLSTGADISIIFQFPHRKQK